MYSSPTAKRVKVSPPDSSPNGKCHKCGRRELVLVQCKCGDSFCSRHKSGLRHKCNFDAVAVNRKKLEETLARIEPPKMVYIDDV